MNRQLAVQVAALLAIGAAAFGVGMIVADRSGVELVVVQDVPGDVRAELDVTWERFIDRFAGRQACFADVSLVLVRDVEGGDARYVSDGARIEIEIPTTPARFRESLAHELAHHVERTCNEFSDLRSELHPFFGGSAREWSGGDVWEETPSELWAEAVVQLVNGERLLHADEMMIDPTAIGLIEEWGRG